MANDQLKALGSKAPRTNARIVVSDFSKAKRTLDGEIKRILADRQQARGGESPPILVPEWRLHDIRRTGATIL